MLLLSTSLFLFTATQLFPIKQKSWSQTSHFSYTQILYFEKFNHCMFRICPLLPLFTASALIRVTMMFCFVFQWSKIVLFKVQLEKCERWKSKRETCSKENMGLSRGGKAHHDVWLEVLQLVPLSPPSSPSTHTWFYKIKISSYHVCSKSSQGSKNRSQWLMGD